jgi:hypothetical protein
VSLRGLGDRDRGQDAGSGDHCEESYAQFHDYSDALSRKTLRPT